MNCSSTFMYTLAIIGIISIICLVFWCVGSFYSFLERLRDDVNRLFNLVAALDREDKATRCAVQNLNDEISDYKWVKQDLNDIKLDILELKNKNKKK